MEFPQAFWQGVDEFNAGEFYPCHDTLEAIWLEAIDPDKTFFQGILQIAVGYYHLSNHNWKGCLILLGEGTNRLRRYRPEYETIDVETLFLGAIYSLQTLQQAGEDRVAEFAAKYGLSGDATDPPTLLLPKIQTVESST